MNAPCLSLIAPGLPFASAGSFEDNALSLSTGLLVVVLGALIVLARLVSDLRTRITALENAGRNSLPPSPAPLPSVPLPMPADSAQPAPCLDALSPDLIAVIVAAVHVTLGRQIRIVGITPAPVDDHLWSLEGRRQIFHSHKTR